MFEHMLIPTDGSPASCGEGPSSASETATCRCAGCYAQRIEGAW